MGNLEFNTEIEAIEAERAISLGMGLPKYGLRQDGTPNVSVIIDKWDIPTLNDNGKWVIQNPVLIERLYFSTPEERDAFNAAEAEFAGADPSLPYLETGEDELGYYLLVDVIAKPSLWQRFKNLF